MNWKLKLLWVAVLAGWLATTSAQTIKQINPSPRLLIIGDYFSGYAEIGGGNKQITYDVLRAFIVNDSEDTLRYWGTSCRTTALFTVTDNDFFHLVDGDCKDSIVEEQKIPPHRSQLIPLRLIMEKQPHSDIELRVSMNFYRWLKTNSFSEIKKHQKPELLTDKITLRYNEAGSRYYDRTDDDEQESKTKLNLPTMGLYLLTGDERKLYTVTADETKI